MKVKIDIVMPLLLSKSYMKRAGAVIDLNTDTVTVFTKRIKLQTSSLGHNIMPLYHVQLQIKCTRFSLVLILKIQ